MYFSRAIASLLLAASTGLAAVLPRQANTTASSLQSDSFVLRSQLLNDTSKSLGWLHAEYSYPPGYYATLHTSRSDAIVGHLTDTFNVSNSSLVFPESGGNEQGFVLYPLSSRYPQTVAQIFSGQSGTKGVFVDEGGLLEWANAGAPMSWYACNQTLEWGTATAVWYKWRNATMPSNCVDIQLVAEYAA